MACVLTLSFGLVQSAKKVHAFAHCTPRVVRVVGNRSRSFLEGLKIWAGVNCRNQRLCYEPSSCEGAYITQHINHIFFFKEFKYSFAQAVEVWRKGTQVHGAWICFQRVHHPFRQGLGHVEGDQARSP